MGENQALSDGVCNPVGGAIKLVKFCGPGTLMLSRMTCNHQDYKAHTYEHKASEYTTNCETISTQDTNVDGQLEELKAVLEQDQPRHGQDIAALAAGEDASSPFMRLGIRAFVGRRLFAALGEALFECQRFKAKGNEAVDSAEGEMAFVAMYLRRNAQKFDTVH